jgi:integrase
MARMKYVQRRANRFEFRFPLPDGLAGKPVPVPWPESLAPLLNQKNGRLKTEIIRSLRTAEARVAERRALAHIAEGHRLVEQARRVMEHGPPEGISPEQIANLVREHEVELLERDEKLRRSGLGVDLRSKVRVKPDGAGMTDDDLKIYEFVIQVLDQGVRKQAAKMRPSEMVALAVNRAVERRGIVLHPDDPAWRELELGFVQAERQAFDWIKARLDGETVPTPTPPIMSAAPGQMTISVAYHRWADGGGRGARKPREGSVKEAERAVQRFIELHGDMPITAITKAHGRTYRDALASLPKALPDRLRTMRLPALLKQDLSRFPKRSAQTVNKVLALLGGLFARAERDGFFEPVSGWSNPFHVGFEIARNEKQPFEPFSPNELQTLFASPVFTQGSRPHGGKGEAAYWFPLVSLFSGARRTEIAQLKVGDVRQGEGDIWFFDFSDRGEDQRLKNESSARSVPVHSELIRLGLLHLVTERARRTDPSAPLWPGFEPPVDPKTKAWSKWFGRYLGEQVVDHPSKTFHSFRHTFKRACREAGISEEIHHALTGHSGGGVGRAYGRERRADGSLDRGISLVRLQAEINRVSYAGLVLPRLGLAG